MASEDKTKSMPRHTPALLGRLTLLAVFVGVISTLSYAVSADGIPDQNQVHAEK